MYLALCLSLESEQAIRTGLWWDMLAPATPSEEFHLTVIHSPEPYSTLQHWWMTNSSRAKEDFRRERHGRDNLLLQPISASVDGLGSFGGKTKVTALQLVMNGRLEKLRVLAEAVLFDASIPWSKQWGFSPHITLGRGKVKLAETFPSVVTFDRMEWRE